MQRSANQPRLLYIDSRERVSGETHNANFILHTPIKGASTIRVTSASIPITAWNIGEHNNILYCGFRAYNSADPTTYTYTHFNTTLKPGFYDITSFGVEIKRAMEAESLARFPLSFPHLSVTVEYIEGRHAFKITPNELRWNGEDEGDNLYDWLHFPDKSELGGNWFNSVNYLLGNDVTDSPVDITPYIDSPVNTAGMESTYICRLLMDSSLLMHVSFVNDSTSASASPVTHVLARIPSQAPGNIVSYFSSSNTEIACQVSQSTISDFRIWFTNHRNVIQNLNGAEFSIGCALTYHNE